MKLNGLSYFDVFAAASNEISTEILRLEEGTKNLADLSYCVCFGQVVAIWIDGNNSS